MTDGAEQIMKITLAFKLKFCHTHDLY